MGFWVNLDRPNPSSGCFVGLCAQVYALTKDGCAPATGAEVVFGFRVYGPFWPLEFVQIPKDWPLVGWE